MKVHITTDKELEQVIRKGLIDNDGYCPCVVGSHGKKQYKCMCEDFRENINPGNSCHCGLYIKDE